MKKRLITAVTMLIAMVAGAWADGVHFQYDPSLYPDEHVIYVALTDINGTVLSERTGLDGTYYLGAFIGSECRGEAQVEFYNEWQENIGNLFQLRVRGDGKSDNGKSITFHVYQRKNSYVSLSEAEYWIPDSVASVQFSKEATDGTPSNPYKIMFIPATSVSLPPTITVHVGEQLNLYDQIQVAPENSLIPRPLDWGRYPEMYFAIADDILDANGVTTDGGNGITLTAGVGELALRANTTIIVDNPAVAFEWTDRRVTKDANDGSKGTVKVPVGDANTLLGILSPGGYTLTGKKADTEATTTYEWTSSNPAVVNADPTGGVMPMIEGTAVLTGTPQDGTTTTSPRLTVEVVQPIIDFTFGPEQFADTVVVFQVGDNVTERLKAMVNVVPENASNKEYTIKFTDEIFEEKDGIVYAKQANCDGTYPIYLDENAQYLTISANDQFGASKLVQVLVIPKQPTAIVAKQPTLSLVTPEAMPVDITAELYGNLKLTPDTMDISNFDVFMNVVRAEEPGEMYEEVIVMNGEDEKGRPTFLLVNSGKAIMDVNLLVMDNLNVERDNYEGRPIIRIENTVLYTKFDVVITEGLSHFLVESIRTTAGETVELTLTPQPENVEYNANMISVTITPSVPLPQGWTFAEVKAKEGDATGLKWVVTTKSVGNGTVNVLYGKDNGSEPMGEGAINVDQQLQLNDGWQWISLYQGQVLGKDTLRMLFDNKLGEIRSDAAVLYNDAQFGYFGALTMLDTLKTYKLRMQGLEAATPFVVLEAADVSTYFLNNNNLAPTGGPVSALSIKTRKGWNWIGNPYQYYQKLSDIFGNTVFSENDEIRGKTAFAKYENGEWKGELKYLTPGEGYLINVANTRQIDFVPEFSLTQQTEVPAGARVQTDAPNPWTINHSRFIDNMSMIAHIGGMPDASRLTLYAFAGGECRGRGVSVGDRQFITIHGERGERFTFCVYDGLTHQFYDVDGSRAFVSGIGTCAAPVPLYVSGITSVEAIENKAAMSSEVYDLQGRRVASGNAANGKLRKGIYVQRGRKVVK